MNKIKIFLASSSELRQDREQFEIMINRKNKEWISRGIFIELVIWEDFSEAMSKTRLQDEYNKAIAGCDIFVLLIFSKVGKYSMEEFDIAYTQFIASGKPKIYTYFKEAMISTGELDEKVISLIEFKKKLNLLGHFPSLYKNTEDLKYQFNKQLDTHVTQNKLLHAHDLSEKPPADIKQFHSGSGDNIGHDKNIKG